MTHIKNAELIKFFFEKSNDQPDTYFCSNAKCKSFRGNERKAFKQEKNKGFTNLRNHLRSCVGSDFEETFQKHLRDAGGNLENFC